MNPNPFMAADEFDIEREELLAEIEQLKAKKQFTDTKPLVGHAGDELKRAIALNEFATTIDSLNTEIERLKAGSPAYQQELAEKIAGAMAYDAMELDKPTPLPDIIAAVLAAEGVVDPAEIEQLKAKNATEYRRGHDDGVRAEALTNDHDS